MHFGDVALSKEDCMARIEPTGQEVEGDIARVDPKLFGVRHGCQRMVVSNKNIDIAFFLEVDALLHHAEIVAEV